MLPFEKPLPLTAFGIGTGPFLLGRRCILGANGGASKKGFIEMCGKQLWGYAGRLTWGELLAHSVLGGGGTNRPVRA